MPDLNTLTVAGLETNINNLRNENNDDYLDATKILAYLNNAIDELNLDDDFVFKKKSVTYDVDTEGTGTFYLFSTLIPALDLDHISEVRIYDRYCLDSPLVMNRDYKVEPNPNGSGQGIRFIRVVQATIQIIYFAYIPKVSLSTDIIDLPYTCNGYFINKVLQFVYESEHVENRALYFANKANVAMQNLRTNNMYESETQLLTNGSMCYG